AEYLSLGQVPDPAAAPASADAHPSSTDEVFGFLAENARPAGDSGASGADDELQTSESDHPRQRAFRSPWKWERLLAESKVVAGSGRRARRLDGLVTQW